MGFTKLDEGIVLSSVWSEPPETRVVWVTLLAMADQNGVVRSSLPGLVRTANIPHNSVVAAINTFLSPDQYSRTKDNEGRRIEEIEGGWRLLNYAKYRRWTYSDSPEAVKKRRQRGVIGDTWGHVPTGAGHSASASASASVLQEGGEGGGPETVPIPELLNRPEFLAAWQSWKDYRKEDKRKPVTPRSAKMQLKQLSAMGWLRAVKAIENSIANQYQGIFEPQPEQKREKTFEEALAEKGLI